MQLPYQNIGEANGYSAFITGADGHDKASILRRMEDRNLPDIEVLDDDGWQRLIYLIDAAPKLLASLDSTLRWLETEVEFQATRDFDSTPLSDYDIAALDALVADIRHTLDLAMKGKP